MNIKLAQLLRTTLAVTLVSIGCSGAQAAAPAPACTGANGCFQTQEFRTQVVDFRNIGSGHTRTSILVLRFTNLGKDELVLGYPVNTANVVDDQGNVYQAQSVTGIGEVRSGQADTRFKLAPGESANATFNLTGQFGDRILGTRFNFDTAIDRLAVLPSNQVRTQKQYSLNFTNLAPGMPAGAAAATAPVAAAPATPPAGGDAATAGARADACGGDRDCYDGGDFVARVKEFRAHPTTNDGHYVFTVHLGIQNRTAQELILGYRDGTGQAVDNEENLFTLNWAMSSVTGLGKVTDSSVDPRFRLAPGASADAQITVSRGFRGYSQAVGRVYSFNIALDQIEVLPSRQVRAGRQYSVYFNGLTPGSRSASAGTSGQPAYGDPTGLGQEVKETTREEVGRKVREGIRSIFR